MNGPVKFGLYVLLLVMTALSGWQIFTTYTGESPSVALHRKSAKKTKKAKPALPASTNLVIDATNTLGAADSTNAAAAATIESTNTSSAAQTADPSTGESVTNTVAETPATQPAAESDIASSAGAGHNLAPASRGLGKWLATGILALVGLGGLLAWDIAQFFGNRALRFMYNDDGAGYKDPGYDEAEKEWANGNFLEAVRLLREFIQKNPKQVHAFIRIAEIYEKDLNNNLAAALEYEEILNLKLPPERWGWSAIHLCNLYSKLGRQDDAVALLQRIGQEHSQTPAAEKARKRLEEMEAAGYELPKTKPSPTAAQAATPPAPTEPPSGLPPGFRRKK